MKQNLLNAVQRRAAMDEFNAKRRDAYKAAREREPRAVPLGEVETLDPDADAWLDRWAV